MLAFELAQPVPFGGQFQTATVIDATAGRCRAASEWGCAGRGKPAWVQLIGCPRANLLHFRSVDALPHADRVEPVPG